MAANPQKILESMSIKMYEAKPPKLEEVKGFHFDTVKLKS